MRSSRPAKALKHTTLLCTIALLSACGPVISKPAPFADLKSNASNPVAPDSYKIGIGDEIEVKFFFTPELNDLLQVRPDGKISVMFAQDIQAAGKTPEELSSAIKDRLSKHLKQLDLVVVVRSFGSQKAYVSGEVGKPGPLQLSGNENLMQVLSEAGWVTPAAKRDEIVLVRKGQDGKEAVYPINIDNVVSGKDMAQNIIVQPGDVILVPPSDAVAFDRWMDRNVRQAIPVNLNAGAYFNRQLGSGN